MPLGARVHARGAGTHPGLGADGAADRATVLILVIDLDRPYRGLVTVSQQPMLDLIQGLPPA